VLHWRIGATNKKKVDPATKGIPLAYIDARDVMKRLDEVVGMDGWQCNYILGGNGAVCNIGLLIKDEWIWKADGAGETDVEGAKGALSDAFKRAAVRFGVGRYLYYLPNDWVDLYEFGKFDIPKLPKWAIPKEE